MNNNQNKILDNELFTELIDFILSFKLCENGSVIDIVRKLNTAERKMSEEHIAYILKYTIKVRPYMNDYKHVPRHILLEMAVYKTKGLPVQLSTVESIGGTLNANSIVLGFVSRRFMLAS